jgi:hypothetical protein
MIVIFLNLQFLLGDTIVIACPRCPKSCYATDGDTKDVLKYALLV